MKQRPDKKVNLFDLQVFQGKPKQKRSEETVWTKVTVVLVNYCGDAVMQRNKKMEKKEGERVWDCEKYLDTLMLLNVRLFTGEYKDNSCRRDWQSENPKIVATNETNIVLLFPHTRWRCFNVSRWERWFRVCKEQRRWQVVIMTMTEEVSNVEYENTKM